MQTDKIPTTDASKGLGGLVNMGLTCYANAVMQNMRHIGRLSWILEDGKYNSLFDKREEAKERRQLQQKLTTSFAEVTQMLWKCGRGQSVRPGEFWKDVPALVEDTMYEHLATKAPHDAHEFFLFLLESIHEATAQEVEMRIVRPPAATPQEKLVHGALTSWQREFSKEYSPFTDLFFGLAHWQTACQTCGNVSHSWESFTSLKLPISKGGVGEAPPNFADMLQEEFASESIDGYQCDKCPERSTAKRFMRIWRLPQTLVLVIKRFTPDGRKMHTRVAPMDGGSAAGMDLRPFFSEHSPERNGATHYALRGIVDHHGSSSFGHYTAQCRHPADDKWHIYDDEGVGDMQEPVFGDSTYMLFMERATPLRAQEA